MPLGPGSEVIGGPGALSYDDMLGWLRRARCYLYTGTQPASYTLGLIEAMMTGIPVVSIGPAYMNVFPYGPDLFEGHELADPEENDDPLWSDDPSKVRAWLDFFLDEEFRSWADYTSEIQRTQAIDLFGRERIGAEWKAYLG
jgi:glycosyltransferase involved in cell wall biosynthesis